MRKIKHTLLMIATTFLLVSLAGCGKKLERESYPAGPLMADSIHFQFAVYYLPRPTKDPMTVLKHLLAREHLRLKIVPEMQDAPDEPIVVAHMQNNVLERYPPPDMESLQYYGRGLSRGQMQALQRSEQALVLDFAHPKSRVWEALRSANKIAEAVARKTGGLVWDNQTKEIFSTKEWQQRRIASWTKAKPDISNHTTIHAYKAGEYVRAITLGMSKVGLPDVVVEDFSWSLSPSMGNLINIFCQAMAEGTSIAKPGEFDLELRAIKNALVRDPQLKSLKANAKGVALLALVKGKREQGDPKNRLIEITFDRYEGINVHAQQENLLSAFFGSEDAIARVNHRNEDLVTASRQAKARLPKLFKAFKAGLRPGEFIQVKAPFATPNGGSEWMWVEVTAWHNNTIKGILKNEPFYIPHLHSGQLVKIHQDEVFDYIRHYPNGREEGNETGSIMQKMQQGNN